MAVCVCADALVMWGGKIKHLLIAYILCNNSAKNCKNQSTYVQVIASYACELFLEHSGVILWKLYKTQTWLLQKNRNTISFVKQRTYTWPWKVILINENLSQSNISEKQRISPTVTDKYKTYGLSHKDSVTIQCYSVPWSSRSFYNTFMCSLQLV